MADVVLNLKAINDQLMKALAESEAAFRKLSEAAKKRILKFREPEHQLNRPGVQCPFSGERQQGLG